MGARGPALLRSLVALTATAALVVGVPLVLIATVGNPLPEAMPTVDELRVLLTQTGQGFSQLVIGALAVLIWFIWAQLVIALVVEIIAVVRHAETRRLPAMPGVQRLAAGLVAAVTLAATLTAAPLMASSAGALQFEDLVTAPTISLSSVEPSIEPVMIDLTEPAVEQSLVSLQLHDHTELWDVAETAYGDGMSWKLIAALNAGRTDGTGATMTNETAVVAPGTILHLSGLVNEQALIRHGTIEGAKRSASNAHRVVPGDSMWAVAESQLADRLDRPASQEEVAAYWVDLVESNKDVPSGDADLIYPGDDLRLPGNVVSPAQELDLDGVADGPSDNRNRLAPQTQPEPATPVLPPTQSAAESETTADSEIATESEPTAAPEIATEPESAVEPDSLVGSADQADGSIQSDQDYRAVGLAGLGAAVLAAGIVGALHRRRDRQRRTRPVAAIARPPSSTAAAFEAALLQASSELRESDHGGGWQALPAAAVEAARMAGSLQFHAEESGRLRAVAIIEDGDESAVRSVEFDASDAVDHIVQELGRSKDVLRPEGGGGSITMAPTSLLIGTECASGEAVFLDLMSSGAVSIIASPADARRLARTAVLDLALSDRAQDLMIIAVGIAGELADLERVTSVEDLAEALEVATRSGHGAPDSSTPIIVVASESPTSDPASSQALSDLGACIVGPNIDAAVQITIDHVTLDGRAIATLSPLGTQVELTALDDNDFASVAELVDTSSSAAMTQTAVTHNGVTQNAVTHNAVTQNAMAQTEFAPSQSEASQPGPVEVQVLGPVQVAGADSFSSRKAVDVVAYLAFHRNGADADQIKSWVWPAYQPPTDKAFANVLSRARRGLGAADDGTPYLSRAGADRTYRLSPDVTTDFDRFRAIVEQADAAATLRETVTKLSEALELIRGVPFTGGGASSFVWADNHVRAQVEFAIDEAVHRCADLALDVDDLETARWAALKGLELVPGCEQCFRRRFLVAGAGQNRSELRRAMADLERSAAIDLGEPEGVDLISGDLLDLYHQLDQTLVAGSS